MTITSNRVYDFDVRICEITLAHRQSSSKGHHWNGYRKGRKVWGVACISEGEMQYHYQGGKCKRLLPGDVAIIPSSVAYSLSVPNHVETCVHHTINFRMEGDLSAFVPHAEATIFHPADFERIEVLFEKCVHTWEEKQLGYRMQATSILYQIVHDILLSKIQDAINPAAYKQTFPALEYMI